MSISFHAVNEEGTNWLGKVLAKRLPPGSVVSLIGTLGAGKTRLVQAVAQSLGVAEGEVTSPTFVLIKEYAGERPIYHFDTYRLRDEDEFMELGPDEYFDADGLSFVEWGDRVEPILPADRLDILVEVEDVTARRFTLTRRGDFPEEIFESIRADLEKAPL